MLYYGDRVRAVAPREELAGLRARVASPPRSSADEQGRSCALLVSAGELAQGLADALFERCGADADAPLRDASMALAAAAARAAWGSWTGALDDAARAAPAAALARLEAMDLPARVHVRLPEGFLHYAVYPECHGEAARRLSSPPRIVLGVRSIGTSLAAMASAATGAAVVTVRPTGHPFERRVALSGELAERVAAACRAGARVAVADEGSGLSGSSFLAVARWLEEAGARRDRIALLPGHDGPPGAAASDEARARWSLYERRTVAFEELVLPR